MLFLSNAKHLLINIKDFIKNIKEITRKKAKNTFFFGCNGYYKEVLLFKILT